MLTQPTRILIAAVIFSASLLALNIWRPFPADKPQLAAAALQPAVADVDTMIANLEARLRENPTDGEGFRMLGWSYLNTGRPQQSVDAFKNAAQLLPDRADVRTSYGEALVAASGGIVTPEAKAQFEQALQLDPTNQAAREFLTQGKVPVSSSAMTDERDAISPSMSIPATMPSTDRELMISGMVERLAARLRSDPRDADGWVKLIRSRIVLKDNAQARQDIQTARGVFKSDPAALEKIQSVAGQIGL